MVWIIAIVWIVLATINYKIYKKKLMVEQGFWTSDDKFYAIVLNLVAPGFSIYLFLDYLEVRKLRK